MFIKTHKYRSSYGQTWLSPHGMSRLLGVCPAVFARARTLGLLQEGKHYLVLVASKTASGKVLHVYNFKRIKESWPSLIRFWISSWLPP